MPYAASIGIITDNVVSRNTPSFSAIDSQRIAYIRECILGKGMGGHAQRKPGNHTNDYKIMAPFHWGCEKRDRARPDRDAKRSWEKSCSLKGACRSSIPKSP